MPKQRASSHKQLHFAVQPWQLKTKSDKQQEGHDIQYADLIGGTDMHTPDPTSRAPVQLPSETASPWILKGKTTSPRGSSAGADQDAQHSLENALECGAGDDAGGAAEAQERDGVADDWLDDIPCSSQTGVLEGTCHMALLPSGHMSGHVIQRRTHRTFGIMARCVYSTPGRRDCIMDEDMEVLKLRLLNFQTNEEAQTVVTKSGGDMARLQPAEPWQLRDYLGIDSAEQAAEMLELQVSFSADQLLEGSLADKYLHKYNPQLEGRNAVINSGTLQVRGLPPAFLG